MTANNKSELMRLFGIDENTADDVVAYVELMKDHGRKRNDFALAKALNERATSIVDMVANEIRSGIQDSVINTAQVNKSYILLVDELKRIYARTPELSDATPSPIWNYIDLIEGNEYEIYDHIWERQNDAGQRHNAQVNKLCIIAGSEYPSYTPRQQKIVDETDKAIAAYRNVARELNRAMADSSRGWMIPEYRFTYGTDGSLLVNDVPGILKVRKAHVGSASERLLEQAARNPNELFKPDLGQYSRNISTTLSGLGFSGTLKRLFFPIVSDSKGIKFRPVVSRDTADAEGINTFDLDAKLKERGAKTEEKPLSLDDIPF